MDPKEVGSIIGSIETQLKMLKKHHGVGDPDDVVEEVEEVTESVAKQAPRRRGRHAKGMPFFKKGDE